jgi:hypothetical protein
MKPTAPIANASIRSITHRLPNRPTAKRRSNIRHVVVM